MGPPADTSEAAEDAALFGFPEETVAAIGAAGAAGDFEIWPENWDIFAAFVGVSTQWRAAALPNGRLLYIGLDYAGARAGLEAAGIAVTPDLWTGVRVMEDGALAYLNGRRL